MSSPPILPAAARVGFRRAALLIALLAAGCIARKAPAPEPAPAPRLERSLPVGSGNPRLLPFLSGGTTVGWALVTANPGRLEIFAADGSAAPPLSVETPATGEWLAADGGFYGADGTAVRRVTAGGETRIETGDRIRALALGPAGAPWLLAPTGARPLLDPAAAPRPADAAGGERDELWLLADAAFTRARDGARVAPAPAGLWAGAVPGGFLAREGERLRYYDGARGASRWSRRCPVPPAWIGGLGDDIYLVTGDGLLHVLREKSGFERAIADLGQRGRIYGAPWAGGMLIAAAEGRRMLWTAPGRPVAILHPHGGGRIAGLVAAGPRLALLTYHTGESYTLDIFTPG